MAVTDNFLALLLKCENICAFMPLFCIQMLHGVVHNHQTA